MFRKNLQNKTTTVESPTTEPEPEISLEEMTSDLGLTFFEGFIGLNEVIKKPVQAYMHPLLERQTLAHITKYYTPQTLPTGETLYSDNHAFNGAFLRSDIIERERDLQTVWSFAAYDKMSEWLHSVTQQKQPKQGWFLVKLTNEEMLQVLRSLHREIMKLTSEDTNVAKRLLGFLLVNDFKSIPVMLHIAEVSSDEQAQRFINLMLDVDKLQIPIQDYYALYETMNNMSL